MKSKTIIISSEKEKSGRGILTLYEEDELLKCKLRLYNFPKLNANCKLGVYHQKEVYSSNFLEKNGAYESSLVGDFNMDEDFYCAVVDTSQNNTVLLSGGTYSGFFFEQNNVFENKIEKNELINSLNDQPQQILKEEIEDCEDKCKNCKYKEYFYCENKQITNPQSNVAKQEENKQDADEKEQSIPSLIETIVPQFENLFENYPLDEDLNSMIPNSKFVKFNEGQERYSIGAIYKDSTLSYICYAVKCEYNTPAPKELGEHYQWLPLDKEDPLSAGYYIVFQDANDLKIVEI